MKCDKSVPDVAGATAYRSLQQGRLDLLLALIYIIPFRCRTCGNRFYRHVQPHGNSTAAPLPAVGLTSKIQ